MNKEKTWELLEIHNLLADVDKSNNYYGLSLLTEFIENYGFKNEAEDE
jgi:hypothetical protein